MVISIGGRTKQNVGMAVCKLHEKNAYTGNYENMIWLR